jgi:hypothetical protein
MTSLTRVLACMIAEIVADIGLIVVAIFGPLRFPLSLTDSSRAENGVIALAVMLFLLFGTVGVTLCWKFTQRFSK